MRNWPLALIGRTLVATFLIVYGGPVVAQGGAQRLPTLGDSGEMGASAERRLGDGIARELYRDPDYLDDGPLQEYVDAIWQALLAAARARGEIPPELDERFSFELFLGRDRTVNAFALPGGYMGVNLGLVGVVATPDELASVLAHELSHLSQRHIARLIGQQEKAAPLMLGAMVLAILAASKNPQAAQAVAIGGQALVVQNQLNFSRDMEREADRIGLALMAPVGFAPRGFVDMFDKLQQANRLNDNGSWPYLRSHPLTSQRVADMQSRQPPGSSAAPVLPSFEDAMLAARARVLTNPGVDVWRQWLAEPQGTGFAALAPVRQSAVLYAAVLSASQLREAAAARQWLAPLLDLVRADAPALRQAQLLAAEIELAAGQAEAALRAIPAKTASTTSTGRPELLLRTQALLQTPKARTVGDADMVQVAGRLQTRVATHPQDATAWQLLASVWQAQGQLLRAVRAEAEAHAARYDYAAAVDRFTAGQELARKSHAPEDFVEASIIDTRLRTMQSLLREQAAQR